MIHVISGLHFTQLRKRNHTVDPVGIDAKWPEFFDGLRLGGFRKDALFPILEGRSYGVSNLFWTYLVFLGLLAAAADKQSGGKH